MLMEIDALQHQLAAGPQAQAAGHAHAQQPAGRGARLATRCSTSSGARAAAASEKFHGAVVDHVGHENTRVFRDVAELGAILQKLDPVIGTTVQPDVAIIYDWENRWAIDDMQGLGRDRRKATRRPA